ncbi:hypothetical protein HDE_03623 [Halotydeus destructor]|nr:hypothetical protein HDE_03623 [Halotydeus destructor]
MGDASVENRRLADQNRAINQLESKTVVNESLDKHKSKPKVRHLLCCGQIRTCRTISIWEKVFLYSAIFLFAVLVFLISRKVVKLVPFIVDTKTKDANKPDFTLCLLLLWTALWGFYHAVFGILCEQFLDLIAYVATLVMFIIYIVGDYLESSSTEPFQKVFLVAVVISTLLIILGIYLTQKYYKAGIDGKYIDSITRNVRGEKKSANWKIHRFGALTKLDVQLSTSAIVLWLQTGFIDYEFDNTELIFVVLGVLETALWYTFGYFAIKRQSRVLMYLFYMVSFLEPGAIIYNLYRTISESQHTNDTLRPATLMCSFAALGVRVMANFYMYQVSKTFNVDQQPTEQDGVNRSLQPANNGSRLEQVATVVGIN